MSNDTTAPNSLSFDISNFNASRVSPTRDSALFQSHSGRMLRTNGCILLDIPSSKTLPHNKTFALRTALSPLKKYSRSIHSRLTLACPTLHQDTHLIQRKGFLTTLFDHLSHHPRGFKQFAP